jgi:iron(III) transport system permease protein
MAMAALSVVPLAALGAHAAPEAWRALEWLGESVASSLTVSLGAAVVALPLAVVLGHGLARGGRAARLGDLALSLGFFLPSAVLGVGIVATWNHPSTRFVYGSSLVMILGLVARYAALAVRAFAAAVGQTSPSYEEAAATLGAGYPARLARVVVPMHGRALVASFALVLVFSLRDLETVVMFYPPGQEPLTVRIFTLEANGPTRVVAALALLHTGITASALGGLAWWVRRLGP